MRDRLRALFGAALRELDAGDAVRRHARRAGHTLWLGDESFDLGRIARVHLLAIGKAARPTAAALLPYLDGVAVRGLVVPPTGAGAEPLPPLELVPGGHPVPDAGSLRAAERALALLGSVRPDDLVLFLISGGGSALCEMPLDPSVSLADLQALHRLLVDSGADIATINLVRKHCSAVKGGRLAARAAAARQHSLILSDVPVDRLDLVASGPTMPDPTTLADLDQALDRCALRTGLPASLRSLLERRRLPETPKPAHPAFARARWLCVLDQQGAIAALQQQAAAAGFATAVATTTDDLTAPQLAERLLRALARRRADSGSRPAAVIAGGELSVALPEVPGTGGRNQQFALECALRITDQPIAVLSCGTDGIDGSSPAAGAVADGTTVARARALGLDAADHLRRCDTFPLFHALGDTVVTGPTGTNLRDLRVLVQT